MIYIYEIHIWNTYMKYIYVCSIVWNTNPFEGGPQHPKGRKQVETNTKSNRYETNTKSLLLQVLDIIITGRNQYEIEPIETEARNPDLQQHPACGSIGAIPTPNYRTILILIGFVRGPLLGAVYLQARFIVVVSIHTYVICSCSEGPCWGGPQESPMTCECRWPSTINRLTVIIVIINITINITIVVDNNTISITKH